MPNTVKLCAAVQLGPTVLLTDSVIINYIVHPTKKRITFGAYYEHVYEQA